MSSPTPPPRRATRYAATLALGAAGGAVASVLGLPLPWLLGALAATAWASVKGVRLAGGPPLFPTWPRLVCIPVIGVLIGASVTPEALAGAARWWPGLVGVILFVPTALAANYWILRRVGRFDPATAYFASIPGGLIESIEMGGEAGADIRALTSLQFARIAFVVSAVPLLFFAMQGQAVGSAAGVTIGGQAGLTGGDAALLILLGSVGFFGARRIRLPAGQITGPVIVSAIAHGAGLTEAAPPPELVAVAQLVIGVTLGQRFGGLTGAELRRYLSLSALSVAAMLGIGAAFAGALSAAGVAPFAVMILCFAPGGVVEMGLIALSLNASPIFVTAHHIARILAAVLIGVNGWRRVKPR
jgi:membrane AbrB-like protein